MGHLATLISDLALLLVVAGITTLLCKKINQPLVIGYILAGFLIGPVVSFVPTDGFGVWYWACIGLERYEQRLFGRYAVYVFHHDYHQGH